jgi:hypothetical protein
MMICSFGLSVTNFFFDARAPLACCSERRSPATPSGLVKEDILDKI